MKPIRGTNTNELSSTGHTLSELEIINRFAVDMLRPDNLDDLLWSIAQNTGQLLSFEKFVLYLREDNHLYQNDFLKKEIIFRWVFGKEQFDDAKLRQTMFFTTKNVEEYLI